MDPERAEAFEKLRQAAESVLARPEDAAVRVVGTERGLLEFSIVTRPSLAPAVAFAILRTRPDRSGNSSRRICRVSWDAPRDAKRLESTLPSALKVRTFEPSIDVRVIEAPAEVTAWMMEAGTVRVPVRQASASNGTDEDSTTIQFGEGAQASVFRWSSAGPDEWAPLVAWGARVRSRLDALFAGG